MVELLTYTSTELPESIKWQALSFLRVQYPDGFKNENRLRDWVTSDDDHPVYIVLMEKGILISHTNVVWKVLDHEGQTYKVYGLTGVFTYPSFRGQGFGSHIVEAGTEYILKSDADIGMFHCDKKLVNFYARHGWLHMKTSTSYTGTREHPMLVADEELMMMFLSSKGKSGQAAFETKPIYFGSDYTW